MLANVLSSDRAMQVSIRIVEIYIRMKEYVLTNKGLLLKIEQIEKRIGNQDERIAMILGHLKKFIEFQNTPRKKNNPLKLDQCMRSNLHQLAMVLATSLQNEKCMRK